MFFVEIYIFYTFSAFNVTHMPILTNGDRLVGFVPPAPGRPVCPVGIHGANVDGCGPANNLAGVLEAVRVRDKMINTLARK